MGSNIWALAGMSVVTRNRKQKNREDKNGEEKKCWKKNAKEISELSQNIARNQLCHLIKCKQTLELSQYPWAMIGFLAEFSDY